MHKKTRNSKKVIR